MLTCQDRDNAVRWKEGERLDRLFEERCDRLEREGRANHPAAVTGDDVLTYRELDERANQVARHLIQRGIGPGDRVGLLFDKSVHAYVALLAVLKANAAYVPLDPSYPRGRIEFIAKDAGLAVLVTLSSLRSVVEATSVPILLLDDEGPAITAQRADRLTDAERGTPTSQLCYIIYTSGTTGRPKGVAIEHASICNFVKVAAEVYGLAEDDRVYQGMTIAFDFSVEELWVPLISGATLVPGTAEGSLVGDDLADFLERNEVTALCCVPTLLATMERDLPRLRFLLLSGEACPHDLVVRWHRPGRTMLNAYGPTEATVTATWSELRPERPVTIGGPLPTYTVVILHEDRSEEVAHGELGEIGIAGIGLARGYLHRDDLTKRRFIPDFLNIPNNPGGRIYRTGDLGRINGENEIEYHGRIDTQVKIRGYRIELTEIESVLLQSPKIAQAVVDTFEPQPGAAELVAYYTLRNGAADLSREELSGMLRSRLPRYMVPAYIERVAEIPMLPSNKADRKNLPAPAGPRFVGRSEACVPPRNEMERRIAGALESVLKVDQVSMDDDFFCDLGAHSLLMAQFCTEIRRRLGSVNVSMRDIYAHPTVARLADVLQARPIAEDQDPPPVACRIPSDAEYYGCGALQLLYYGALLYAYVKLLVAGMAWIHDAATPIDVYLHVVAFGVTAFLVLAGVPIALKWLLVGRWREERIPVWSLRYFRFWVVRSLVRTSPLALFRGYPIYNLYLRLLGAKIGKHVVWDSKFMPVCTDLVSIGDNTIVRKNAVLLAYKAQGNHIHTGPVTIGRNAFVGEAAVVDIGTRMGDGTQLGHASSLQTGQEVPDGKRYHGSPCRETTADYCPVEPRVCGTARRAAYSLVQLLGLFLVWIPIPVLLVYYLFFEHAHPNEVELAFPAVGLLEASLVLVFGLLLASLAVVGSVPRMLNVLLKENETYVLYGLHFYVLRILSRISNVQFFNVMFGDSSLIVHYLRWIGWKLRDVVQTGSNFGCTQSHETPFLCHVGGKTMVSDGLRMISLQMSSTAFRVCRASLGARNYVGNNVLVPPDSKAGDNCLLATKVLLPIEGPVREGVGLLGSPCFEIPRVVDRDRRFERYRDETVRRRCLRLKNVYNAITLAGFLFFYWLYFLVLLWAVRVCGSFHGTHGDVAVLVGALGMALFTIPYLIFVEWAGLGFKRLRPRFVSMYDRRYWYHERFWKFSEHVLKLLFKGTPFRNVVSRLSGVRIGRKVFDDGCACIEKTLTEVGDYCTLSEASVLQGHSLEEGIFKSDHIKIGRGCTVGIGAFVHYGTTMGDNVVLDPDSFLMKGEAPEPNTTWRGNPAERCRGSASGGR